MLTKKDAAEAVRAAKARLGVTWVQLAGAVGLTGRRPKRSAPGSARCSPTPTADRPLPRDIEATRFR